MFVCLFVCLFGFFWFGEGARARSDVAEASGIWTSWGVLLFVYSQWTQA